MISGCCVIEGEFVSEIISGFRCKEPSMAGVDFIPTHLVLLLFETHLGELYETDAFQE